MNQAPKTHVPKKNKDQESVVAIFLLFMIVFMILTTAILLTRTAKHEEETTTEPLQSESESETNPPPAVSTPVFSGGAAVVLPWATDATAEPDTAIDSKYAVLIDAQSGEVLAQKNSTVLFSPASMTKVMTLIVACEQLTNEDLERKIPLTHEIVEYVTTGEYFGTEVSLPTESGGMTCIGDCYYIKDLLYGIGVMSAADCTYMIVREVAESEDAFVALMNAKARELGLQSTSFDNAVGFDSATNTTTAEDMAVIMAYAMQCELIADILKPRSENMVIQAYYEYDGEEKTYSVYLKPSIKSRLDKYPAFSLDTAALTATKTGYTNESFIVVAAKSKTTGKSYILVLGDAAGDTQESLTQKFKNTMIDVEYMLNTYVS